ncbi:hypothetical protein LIER_43405 [Lithospermum erythrorhizon]|uniref:Uncharacterized protein n=1 Tax=Lithospermum erythrorhizon TaxID=34254 RepID=A0AAV3Q2J3_LITER
MVDEEPLKQPPPIEDEVKSLPDKSLSFHSNHTQTFPILIRSQHLRQLQPYVHLLDSCSSFEDGKLPPSSTEENIGSISKSFSVVVKDCSASIVEQEPYQAH